MEQRTWYNWLFLALAAFTAYWSYDNYVSQPLSSSRPKVMEWKDSSLIGDQFVSSRLWQDPFKAVEQSISLSDVRQHPHNLIQQANLKSANSHVIAVFTEGQPYPEDQETRLRFRYAIQMALASSEYKPEDRSFIGVLTVPWPGGRFLKSDFDCTLEATRWYGLADAASMRGGYEHVLGVTTNQPILAVPFEWFTPVDNTNTNPPVLVLWLREEAFSDLPLRRLHLLLNGYLREMTSRVEKISVLGPRSSDTLEQFLVDAREAAIEPLKDFRLFSCQATAPDRMLIDSHTNKSPSVNRSFLTAELQSFIKLTNCIATDDALAAVLIEELSRRDFDFAPPRFPPGSGPDHIALIAEVDTTYGRGLQTIFRETFEKMSVLTNETAVTNLVHSISYLRGLDGAVATDENKTKDNVQRLEQSPLFHRATFEVSEGQNQMDYARRLARRLYENDLEQRRQGLGNIRAIGILGSDVYDKLILLQAMRAEFPHAIFFTTDMDARFQHPHVNTWARNLLVASPFPLDMGPGTPVFRDAYQTALYRACRMAIGKERAEPPPEPVLFEIGRTRAVSLPLPGLTNNPLLADLDISKASDPTTPEQSGWWKWRVIIPGGAAFLGLLGMLGLFRNIAKRYYKMLDWGRNKVIPSLRMIGVVGKWKWKALSVIGLFSVLFYFLLRGLFFLINLAWSAFQWVCKDYHHGDNEPLVFAQGTSVWPTVFIRIVLTFFCVVVIGLCWRTYQRRLKILESEWFFESTLSKPRRRCCYSFRRSWAWVRIIFRNVSIFSWKPPEKIFRDTIHPNNTCKFLDAEDLFIGCQRRGLLICRFLRMAKVGLFLFCLCFGVLVATGGFPTSPHRGEGSHLVERITLGASIGAIVFLMSYILDTARLAEKVVNSLGSRITIWPTKMEEKEERETGLSRNSVRAILDVRFVGDFTAELQRLFYYPFFALFLMFLSRSSYLDRWPWPFGLKFIFILNFVIIFACSWHLRSGAGTVKDEALGTLRKAAMRTKDKSEQDRISRAIELVKDINHGAYSSWLHDPSVIGGLLPTAAAGLVAVTRTLIGS